MNNIFFTSDWHLGHVNIIKFCNRPFKSVDEMTQVIVSKFNAKVPKNGFTYHLGDMFWKTFGYDEMYKILGFLNGKHYFVWGNHDELLHKGVRVDDYFLNMYDMVEVKFKGYPSIVLNHYAMKVWNKSHHGSWHLYGHSHGDLKEDESLSFDVGVDCWNFEPVSIDEVAVKMKNKAYCKLCNVKLPHTFDSSCVENKYLNQNFKKETEISTCEGPGDFEIFKKGLA